MASPDRLKELRRKLATASIGPKTVDTYLEEMSHLKEELVSDLSSLVEQDEFIRGLGSDYLCVQDEVFFHETAPSEKLCKYVLRRQSILQGAEDERPIYICNAVEYQAR